MRGNVQILGRSTIPGNSDPAKEQGRKKCKMMQFAENPRNFAAPSGVEVKSVS
jgi:hypothetical protein